jgi:hypothetical protein
MKLLLGLILLIASSVTFAVIEVECQGSDGLGGSFIVSVDGVFSRTTFKPTLLVHRTSSATKTYNYTLNFFPVSTNAPRAFYQGAGLTVDVELWPDLRPQWGKTYYGRVTAEALGNRTVTGVPCRFPFIGTTGR